MVVIIGILVYFACGVLAYGFALARLQRAFPSLAEKQIVGDRTLSIVMGVMDPIGLLAVSTTGFKYGLKWW